MPFLMIRDDITKVRADAVVNPANEELLEGSGTSRAIYLAAGEEKLAAACHRIGHCDTGKAVVTKAFGLQAKYVIHAVGPAWIDGNHGEPELLRSAYRESLLLAKKHRLASIAFPLLSSGNYGYPKDGAMKAAIREISDFLMEHEMLVYLVLYDKSAVSLSRKLFDSIEEYIDDHYVETKDERFEENSRFRRRRLQGRRDLPAEGRRSPENDSGSYSDGAAAPGGFEGDASFADDFGQPDFGRSDEQNPQARYESPMVSSPALASAPAPAESSEEGTGIHKKVRQLLMPRSSSGMAGRSLEQLMEHMDETFSQMLLRLIDERGLKDSYVYRKANVDRRHFSKIRNDIHYAPNKKTVLAFAIALELSLDETKDLLMRAGFALSSSSRFDMILCFFIENHQYDIFEINEVLFAYDQPLLGA